MENRAGYLAPVESSTWISMEEMALATGRSATTVRGLLQVGIIPGQRHGQRWYVRRSEFEAWQRGEAIEGRTTDIERFAASVQGLLAGEYEITISIKPRSQT